MDPEFHADVEFWRSIIDWAMGSSEGTLEAPLFSFHPQPHSCTLWSDAIAGTLSADIASSLVYGGGLDLEDDVLARLRSRAQHRDDLFIY